MPDTVRIRDKEFTPYIPSESIQSVVKDMAKQIDQDFRGKQPLFVSILNGAFIFAADLFKELSIECEISFIKLASYNGLNSTGKVTQLFGLEENIAGRHIIILEDIIDTGNTLNDFIPTLRASNPASVNIATLLLKPEALKYDIDIKYVGFKIPNEFIIGYGLDYDGLGRNLKDIYQIVE